MSANGAGWGLRGVSVEAGDATLLKDVELELPAGSWTSVLGPSGAGKTTLLRLLNRLIDPSAGEVSWRGRELGQYDGVRAVRGHPRHPVRARGRHLWRDAHSIPALPVR